MFIHKPAPTRQKKSLKSWAIRLVDRYFVRDISGQHPHQVSGVQTKVRILYSLRLNSRLATLDLSSKCFICNMCIIIIKHCHRAIRLAGVSNYTKDSILIRLECKHRFESCMVYTKFLKLSLVCVSSHNTQR